MSGRPHISEKEKKKKKKLLVELLSKTPIIETACQKLGINRMMLSRWRKSDEEFDEEVEKAVSVSRETINDLAESQIIKKMKDGHFGACAFWLRNNCKRYRIKKAIALAEDKHIPFDLTITNVWASDLENYRIMTQKKVQRILD